MIKTSFYIKNLILKVVEDRLKSLSIPMLGFIGSDYEKVSY